MTLLSLSQIEAGYGELNVLQKVDLDVGPGQIVALIGPNGAGKSTILKSVFNIADVSSGTISFKGAEITHLKTHELLDLGISYVPQGRINFSQLSIEENLLIGAENIRDKDVIRKRLTQVYERFPVLQSKRKELAFSLSGGQHQMLAFGRALMQGPSLLLLDEPSLGLSPILVSEVFDIMKQMRDDGISLLVVEQNAKKAIEIADKTYLLETGKVVLSGGKEMTKHPKIKAVYLGGDVDE